ncbi:MAG: OmpA family protein [Paludibacter sp.]|nr:OmpA family protein [Paludibacter sp.]
MKKAILLYLLIACLFAANASDFADRISKYGRWSISTDAGFSMFNGDLQYDYDLTGILKSPNFGVSLEYNLNPEFSLGWSVGGLFFEQEDINEWFSSGGMYTSTYVSADLLSIIRGKKSRLFGLWFSGGIGFAGSYLPKYTTTRPIVPDPVYSVVFPPTFFIFPLSLSLEYNISKSYSIGLTARQVYTNTDQMESIYRFEYNDMWETLGFSLRYKFITKDKKHFRDEVFDNDDSSMKLISLLQQDVSNLSVKVDGIGSKVDNIEHRVEKLEGILSNDGADTDQDGVPDIRDLEPNTPMGNPVDFWGRSIGVKTIADASLLSVYFDFDSAELDKIAQITIVKVADKMKANPSLMLEIRGYTDNPGSGSYNQKLSQRRSDRVKTELVKVYGIFSKRMVANGKGRIPNPPSKNLGNRRCDFFFSE